MEAPRKKRRLNLLLSQTATALYDSTSFPRAICNRVGQFLGTDVCFNPGDTYVRSYLTRKHYIPQVGRPGGVVMNMWAFDVYTVLRVTPCTLRVKLTKILWAFGKIDDLPCIPKGILVHSLPRDAGYERTVRTSADGYDNWCMTMYKAMTCHHLAVSTESGDPDFIVITRTEPLCGINSLRVVERTV